MLHNMAAYKTPFHHGSLVLMVILFICWVDLTNSNEHHKMNGKPGGKPPQMPRMPSLANAIGPIGSYHMMSEIQYKYEDSIQRSIVEEWAAFDKGYFRLDLATMTERKTYLIYGDTGEIFRYQPFDCDLMNDQPYPKLFKKFRLNQDGGEKRFHDSYIFGIGPLWMLANKVPDEVPYKNYSQPTERPTEERPKLSQYHRYSMDIKQETTDENALPLRLNFYFNDEGPVHNSPSSSGIELLEWVVANKVEARAKVIYLNLRLDDQLMSVFDIPEGYGCMRSEASTLKPLNLMPFSYDQPHQMSLEISASVPKEDGSQWNTHTATVKLIRGKLGADGSKFQIFETQKRNDDDPPVIKRIKKIWDYSYKSHGMLYVIDQEANVCDIFRVSNNTNETIEFAFRENVFPHTIKLNLDTINSLFSSDNEDFHILKSISETESEFKTYVQESRSVGTLNNLSSQASIIRRTTIRVPENATDKVVPHKSSATVLIYDNERKKILAKQTFTIFDHLAITPMFLHKQLDISDCVDDRKDYATIRYLLESSEWAGFLSTVTDDIYNQFVTKMFSIMNLKPLHLSQVDITFDLNYMYIRMLVIDTPNKILLYEQIAFTNFTASKVGEKLKLHRASTVEKCAKICEIYVCRAFAYCSLLQTCIIYSNFSMTHSGELDLDDKECNMYLDHDMLSERSSEPDKVIQGIKEIIRSSTTIEENDNKNGLDGSMVDSLALVIIYNRVVEGSHEISLIPIAIDTDPDTFFSADKNNWRAKASHKFNAMQAEYTLEKRGQKIKVPVPDDKQEYIQSDHLTYEDCSILCQDTDCLSFSYCEVERTCITSKLHYVNVTEKDIHCNVFLRDYLTEFERFPNVSPIATTRSGLIANSPSECATYCMDSKVDICLSFEYCPLLDGPNCFMQNFHGRNIGAKSGVMFGKWDKKREKPTNCDLYTRSYIADFDRLVYMELNIPVEASPERYIEMPGVLSETCADMCIELYENCAGFSTCFNPTASTKVKCIIAQVPLKREYLAKSKSCHTYLLSEKSEFNSRIRHIIPSSSENWSHETSSPADSGWLFKSLVLIFGMMCGCCSVYGYRNRARIIP